MKYHYRNAHIIVSEINLLELGPEIYSYDASEKDHFRFIVTGTNSDTGIRQKFSFALVSNLSPGQRGALDLPYVYKLIDETIAMVLASYGYFITGHAPRGAQFERAFERFILAPTSVAATLSDGTRVVFEGKDSIFEATIETLDGEEFQKRTMNRPYIVASQNKIYPYLAEDIPKWGHDGVTLSKANVFTPEVERAIMDHYSSSRALPQDRDFPAAILAQEGEGTGRAVCTIHRPRKENIVVKSRPAIKPGTRPVSKIEKTAIPRGRLKDEEMLAWKSALRENDQVMRNPHPVRGPYKVARAAS